MLTTVERHKGAVLHFATEIVKNWDQEACFPFASSSSGDSLIDVTYSEDEWLNLFVDFVRKHKSNARAIFWTHRRIAKAGAICEESFMAKRPTKAGLWESLYIFLLTQLLFGTTLRVGLLKG